MDVDRVRLAYLRMMATLHHNAHRAYYPDLPFTEGVELTLITNAIYLAQRDGEPFNIQQLVEHLGMPRTTMRRRLEYLETRGFVLITERRVGRRVEHLLEIDVSILTRPERLSNVGVAAEVIVATAKTILGASQVDDTTLTDQPLERQ